MNFGKDVHPKQVVRHAKDYEVLFEAPNTKAEGLIINPGKDNIVIPKMMVAHIAGKTGALVATAGVTLPSFLIILILSAVISQVENMKIIKIITKNKKI